MRFLRACFTSNPILNEREFELDNILWQNAMTLHTSEKGSYNLFSIWKHDLIHNLTRNYKI